MLLEKISIYGLLIILSLVVLFHLLVLLNIIPFDIVWGGRIDNRQDLILFEVISISVNLIMIAIVAARAGFIGRGLNPSVVRVALWLMFILFLLNTAGNIFSQNSLEKILFTPLTFILAILSLILALKKFHFTKEI